MQTALNELVMDSLEGESEASDTMKVCSAGESGLVLFKYDGYEALKEADITSDLFDTSKWTETYISTGKWIQKGDTIYTLVSGQDWSIVIPVDDVFMEQYGDKTKMTICLKTLGVSVSAPMETFQGADEQFYAKFTLDEYLAAYVQDRFVTIELADSKVNGLKVPKSSVVSKDFFQIPVKYMTTQTTEEASTEGDTSSDDESMQELGVYIENTDGDGDEAVFVTPTVYSKDKEYYYVDDEILQNGIHVLLDGAEDYVVGEKKTLQGVYNVNKGYAVFEEVEVVDENEEYYIVKSSSTYGLVTFDHIVLNAATMSEDDLLY
jgi:hypothetical protein